ncbi:c2 domain containing protein [Stylonychia lemnae]|uniref:C2 domain containing protein n=1 Tax=Stylonychia lemnae TaxID=5949 RepID=A0A077ZMB3_STYLE|nr:c2 domain containing protein [Stylonychia lemnae]|eukprot:CDW71122.1 c2 domain containing protein [Stylonychia lemnae]
MQQHPGGFQQGVQQGELRLRVVQANMYRDTDWLKQFCLLQQVHRKMDPYVVIEYQGHQFKTRTQKNAGKHPIWNEVYRMPYVDCILQEFSLFVTNMHDEIRIKVMDQDFGPDDTVNIHFQLYYYRSELQVSNLQVYAKVMDQETGLESRFINNAGQMGPSHYEQYGQMTGNPYVTAGAIPYASTSYQQSYITPPPSAHHHIPFVHHHENVYSGGVPMYGSNTPSHIQSFYPGQYAYNQYRPMHSTPQFY